ncbi:hypothetical protein Val02_52890 [Virgisporangium aliadipatigenens]|uniref:Uncharacterized protein n=1 Tax=Virgisporangium aliadipatigenens TaxID=741659 RepID=A0A8J4DSZ8_9ACTN|nr:hypothetical protein [Virgisporangium aliadipatigenens]GIJ48403.1 hypothetical protein Val02_52890 [Virgisporangium aliadipatigenens]
MDTLVRTRRVRILSWAQAFVILMVLIGGFGVLLSAAARTGDWAGLADPGLERYGDPKAYVPPVGPSSLLNPLTWVFGLSMVGTMLFGLPLAVLGALVGLPALKPTLRTGDRRASIRLVAGTVGCAAVAVLLLSPYGGQLQTWLLD